MPILYYTQNDLNDIRDKKDASAYNSFVSQSVDISQAYLRKVGGGGENNNVVLSIIRSARDIDNNKRCKFLHQVVLGQKDAFSLPAIEISSDEKARIPSPSGDKLAILKVSPSSDGTIKKQILEIWKNGGTMLNKRIVLPSEKHGAVCTDSNWFGSNSWWNPQETALVYSAEMNKPKTCSYFDYSSMKDNYEDFNPTPFGREDETKKIHRGGTNTLGQGISETWGEKYTETARLNLYIVHVETGHVDMVKNTPSDDYYSHESSSRGMVLGQASFSPCGDHIVYTGWDAGQKFEMPRRLGSIYCFQRPCQIYMSPVKKLIKRLSQEDGLNKNIGSRDDFVYDEISKEENLARSPRFLNGNKLVYLSSKDGFDTHGGCMGLTIMDYVLDLNKDAKFGTEFNNHVDKTTKRVLVDEVRIPPKTQNISDKNKVLDMEFPGIFTNQLLSEPFSDKQFLYITTSWGSCSKIIRISLDNGQKTLINFGLDGNKEGDSGDGSWKTASQTLLGITPQGDALVTFSEPNKPPVIGKLPADDLAKYDGYISMKDIVELPPIAATSSVPMSLLNEKEKNLRYHCITLNAPNDEDSTVPIQAILLLPPKLEKSNQTEMDTDDNDEEKEDTSESTEDEKFPLIVVPHGGPHSVTSTTYLPSYAYLCQHGRYAILHCNYRGSSGFGQDALESLAGIAGEADVEDVTYLTITALKEYGFCLDKRRVGVCGGSHGGYLAGHLIGKYPGLYQAAAMRNPVTNIASMVTATDIPDCKWYLLYLSLAMSVHILSFLISVFTHILHMFTSSYSIIIIIHCRVLCRNLWNWVL